MPVVKMPILRWCSALSERGTVVLVLVLVANARYDFLSGGGLDWIYYQLIPLSAIGAVATWAIKVVRFLKPAPAPWATMTVEDEAEMYWP
jgi:hypothetical protein